MRAIWKYPLKITSEQAITMPIDSTILSVADQNGTLCLWACVNTQEVGVEERTIEIVGTGHPFEARNSLNHLGTVVMGAFVWHVFEELG